MKRSRSKQPKEQPSEKPTQAATPTVISETDMELEPPLDYIAPIEKGVMKCIASGKSQYMNFCNKQLSQLEQLAKLSGQLQEVQFQDQRDLELGSLRLEKILNVARINPSLSDNALQVIEMRKEKDALLSITAERAIALATIRTEYETRYAYYQALMKSLPYVDNEGKQVTDIEAYRKTFEDWKIPAPIEPENLKAMADATDLVSTRCKQKHRIGHPYHAPPQQVEGSSSSKGTREKQTSRSRKGEGTNLLEVSQLRQKLLTATKSRGEQPLPQTSKEKKSLEEYTIVIPLRRLSVKDLTQDIVTEHIQSVIDLVDVDPTDRTEDISSEYIKDWREPYSEKERQELIQDHRRQSKSGGKGRGQGRRPAPYIAPQARKPSGPTLLIHGRRGSIILKTLIDMGPYLVRHRACRIRSLKNETDPITHPTPRFGEDRVAYAINGPYFLNDQQVSEAISSLEAEMQKGLGITHWLAGPQVGEEDSHTQVRLEFLNHELRDKFVDLQTWTIKVKEEDFLLDLHTEEEYYGVSETASQEEEPAPTAPKKSMRVKMTKRQ
jgi:hypothetical protein